MSSLQVQYGFRSENRGARPTLIQQVHGSRVIEVSNPMHIDELKKTQVSADGMITAHPEVELYIFTADCLPLVFFVPEKDGPIAAVHCGWKGAQKGIVGVTLDKLSKYQRKLHVAIGPSIRSCCYEVKEDFIDAFQTAGHFIDPFLRRSETGFFFDLANFVIETQLKELNPSHLHLNEMRCTSCSKPRLPSFRRDGSTNPHLVTWIGRKARFARASQPLTTIDQ